jgi:hypothetical protein
VTLHDGRGIYQPFVFLMRRNVFVAVVFGLRDEGTMTIWVLMVFQILWMVFNHVVKPLKFKSEKAHRIEMMNDWVNMLTLYFMLLFTDLIPNPKHRYNIGWILISIQAVATVTCITLAVIEIICELKKSCVRNQCYK